MYKDAAQDWLEGGGGFPSVHLCSDVIFCPESLFVQPNSLTMTSKKHESKSFLSFHSGHLKNSKRKSVKRIEGREI